MATNVTVGVASFAFRSGGWQEKYFFLQTGMTLPQAAPLLQQIVWGRTALFGVGCTCTFARVSSIDSKHDGLPCDLPYPLGPHPSWNPDPAAPLGDRLTAPNDPNAVIQMRFNTAAGNFWQRYYRCPPDGWITGQILDPSLLPYLQQLPVGVPIVDMSPAGGLSHLRVCQTFWSYLVANTAWAVRVSPNNYNVNPFQYTIFRGITKRNMGRPFGVSRGRRQKTLITG